MLNWLSIAKGIAVVVALVAAYQFIDNNWATDAGIAEGKSRAMEKVQPQLDACRLQELAVSDLVKEGEERRAKAQKGLQDARKSTERAASEAGRLRQLASRPNVPASNCPAGEAVSEIRAGLKP